jgi:serine protease Do
VPASVASKLGIKGGVATNSVRPGSFADELNLTKGTIITEINKKPVTDESSYRSIVSGLKSGQDVVFVVRAPGTSAAAGFNAVGGTLP